MKRFIITLMIVMSFLVKCISGETSTIALTNSARVFDNKGETAASEAAAIRNTCTWGAATNNILLGVGLWGGTPLTVNTYLMSTNSRGYFSGPVPAPPGYRLELSLRDTSGRPVERTRAGDALCNPMNWYMRRTMRIETGKEFYGLVSYIPRRYEQPFDLLDCFEVEKPGVYMLSVKAALYKRTAPRPAEVVIVDIPAVFIPISISQSELNNYPASKEMVR